MEGSSPLSIGARFGLCKSDRYQQTYRRSEVVGRPLAALLANDGARVFSVDIDSIQASTLFPFTGERSNYNLTRRNTPNDLARAQLKIASTGITSHNHPNSPLKSV